MFVKHNIGNWTAITLFFSLFPWLAFGMTPVEIRNDNKDSVVFIRVSGAGPNGVPYEKEASGFLVSTTGEILTAHHIFTDRTGQYLDQLKIIGWPGTRNDGRFRDIEIIDTAPSLDLALLRFKGNSVDYKTVQICPSTQLVDGDPLLAIGFPKDSELSIIDGLLSSKAAAKGWYQTNVDFIEGYSGAPVFERTGGSAVGIVMGGTADVAGRNFFLPIFRANGLLRLLPQEPPCGDVGGNHLEIADGNLNYGQSGFSYAHKEVVAWNSPEGDLLVATTDRIKDDKVRFYLPFDQPPYNAPQDSLAKSGVKKITMSKFSSEEQCGSSGYTYHWYEARQGEHYCLRLRNGNQFVKIRVESVGKDSMTINWK